MRVDYFKMQGTGNRILVVDQRNGDLLPPPPERLRELADDATGPGFDQLMWVSASSDASLAASYRVFNADGSEVEQCGNGVRCVARLLAERPASPRTLVLESPAGNVTANVGIDGRVAVSMPQPEFEPALIPFIAESRAPTYRLDADGRDIEIMAVSIGNPHCVLEVPDVDSAPVERLGPALEHHPRFPQRANVGFMRIVDRAHIELRVHERGVGETLACGTGACAAVTSGQALGRLEGTVDVRLPGGRVVVSWQGSDAPVWLTGNAELISEGTLDL